MPEAPNHFYKEHFLNQWLKEQNRSFSNVHFERCEFDNCYIHPVERVEQCTRISNVRIEKCTAHAFGINNVIFTEVHVDGFLTRRGGFRCLGSFYRHVTLRGRLGNLGFSTISHGNFYATPQRESEWLCAYQRFYEDVDWALDISDAQFMIASSVIFVPGRLVRRNSATQALVTRNCLEIVDWKNLDWCGSSLWVPVQQFMKQGIFDSCVLPACAKSPYRERDLAAIDMLRQKGIANPD